MISGVVTDDREAVIRMKVRGPTDEGIEVEALVDTGFDGFLTLPPAIIERLGLIWFELGRLIMADGSVGLFDIHEANVVWDGKSRLIAVDAVDVDPIAGMALLDGHELTIEVVKGGRVRINALA